MAANDLIATVNGSGNSYLPGLLGIAAALAIWMAGQPVVDEARSLQQQIGIVGQAKSLAATDTIAELETQARQAAKRRAAIEARLRIDDLPAIANAKVLHDLRQRCAAAGIQNCAVKYVDEAPAAGTPRVATPAAPAGAAASLAGLGLSRSKAVISGQFQDLEFRKLIDQLEHQQSGILRVIALTVRSNRFEFEAELITRPLRDAAGNNTQ